MGKLTIIFCSLLLCGCAIGSAASGYSMRAKTAEELTPKERKSIIDEAVAQSVEKCKNINAK